MLKSVSGGGASLHIGQGAESPDMASTQVGDIKLKFQKGESRDVRHVIIDGSTLGPGGKDIHLQLKDGADQTIALDTGNTIRVDGKSLKIDGKPVFDELGQTPDTTEAKSQAGALLELQGRFPGVKFDGDAAAAAGVKIGPDVKIKPGATIELNHGLEIRGKTTIGKDAIVSGGTIRDSKIDGRVRGGELDGCTVDAKSAVHGGELKNTTVGKGGLVKGGLLEDCQILDGKVTGGDLYNVRVSEKSLVADGILSDMRIEKGSTVRGGVLDDFTLRDQDISGGVHDGRVNTQWDEESGTTKRTDAFQSHVHETVEQGGNNRYNPGLYRMDYQGMQNAYDPNMLGYQQQFMQPYGGYQMPPHMMGYNPGIVAPNMGMGAGLGMGMGAGLGMGLGMGAMGMGALGMMGMYGMGMGTMGLGWGGGLGLGGFNWFAW